MNVDSRFSPGGYKNYALRGIVRFDPTSAVDLTLKGYGAKSVGGAGTPFGFGQSLSSDVVNYESPILRWGGRFHSGDAGYRDRDGLYYIGDRVKDMIITGGGRSGDRPALGGAAENDFWKDTECATTLAGVAA